MQQTFRDSYKVLSKITRWGQVLGYKLHSGFYIFYVTPKLLQVAYAEGLILEESYQAVINNNNIEETPYKWIGQMRGRTGEQRLLGALQESTLERLKEALKDNERITDCVVDFLWLTKVIVTYTVDLDTEQIQTNQLYINIEETPAKLAKKFENLPEMVDFLSRWIDREYKNSSNILEYVNKMSDTTGCFYRVSYKVLT